MRAAKPPRHHLSVAFVNSAHGRGHVPFQDKRFNPDVLTHSVVVVMARAQPASCPKPRTTFDDANQPFPHIQSLLEIAGDNVTVTASDLYYLTVEKMFIDTAGQSLEAETHKALMVTDSEAPNFNTHDFRNDITAEVTGTGYTAGGATITTTDITITSGVLKWDHDDVSWASSTIANAMALVDYFNVGTSATDQLICLSDFVTAVSTSNGTLLVTLAAGGMFTLDGPS